MLGEDLKQVQLLARRFVQERCVPLEAELERDNGLSQEVHTALKRQSIEIGLWNYGAPEELGGGGVGPVGRILVMEEAGKTSPFFGWGPGSIIGGGNVAPGRATPRQIEKYFAPVVRGEKTSCGMLTEPDYGSDLRAIETRAIRNGDDWVLNGAKIYITNGDAADFATVLAVTDDGTGANNLMSQFIVEMDTPGATMVRVIPMMGYAGSRQCEFAFTDCRLSGRNVLGEVGRAYESATSGLNSGVRLEMGGFLVGAMERLLKASAEYAMNRRSFGKALAKHQGIQWMLSDIAIWINATRCMTMDAAEALERGVDIRAKSAMVKFFSSESACKAADYAIQIHGGAGYSKDLPLERIYRDLRPFRIFDGTSEIQRIIIASAVTRGEVVRLHP